MCVFLRKLRQMEEYSNNIAQELSLLHTLSGADFSRKVEQIARRSEFHPVENEKDIFSAIDERTPDYLNLLRAARKAVSHGYKVYLLPNPKGIRSADFIFERKGTFRIYFQGQQPFPC